MVYLFLLLSLELSIMTAPVLYIFVNTDLDLSKGRIGSQCSHITQVIVEELVRKGYESFPPPKECLDYMRWKQNPKTIILKATVQQLQELQQKPNARHFIDSGDRIPDNSLTCVGFFPNSDMEEFVKSYRLY